VPSVLRRSGLHLIGGGGGGIVDGAQVEALVSDCGVNPMITDLVRKLWFRYLVIRDNRIANNDSFHLRLRTLTSHSMLSSSTHRACW